jgi:hypothetical protein
MDIHTKKMVQLAVPQASDRWTGMGCTQFDLCAACTVYQLSRVNANISVGQPDSQKKRVVEACLRYLAAEFYFSIEHIAQFIESTEATDDFSLVAD